MNLIQIFQRFPDQEACVEYLEKVRWADNPHCPKCGCTNVARKSENDRIGRWNCRGCKSSYNVLSGTIFEKTRVPLQKWFLAIGLLVNAKKSVSSHQLARDLDLNQKTAWYMEQRIRTAMLSDECVFLQGIVEADETYIGGKEKNKHSNKKLKAGRGPVGKTAVVGIRDRDTNHVSAQPVLDTNKETLQGFVESRTQEQAQVYTDEARAYVGINRPHEAVKHSVGEYVRDMAHTNGMESFWAGLKRGHNGTYHKMSPKHLSRYVNEFSGRHNNRPKDTIDQMAGVLGGMIGKRLRYVDLIADNGLTSGARG